MGEDLWQAFSENSTPGEGLEKKSRKKGEKKGHRQGKGKRMKACERFKERRHQLQIIEADIFSSASVYVS